MTGEVLPAFIPKGQGYNTPQGVAASLLRNLWRLEVVLSDVLLNGYNMYGAERGTRTHLGHFRRVNNEK